MDPRYPHAPVVPAPASLHTNSERIGRLRKPTVHRVGLIVRSSLVHATCQPIHPFFVVEHTVELGDESSRIDREAQRRVRTISNLRRSILRIAPFWKIGPPFGCSPRERLGLFGQRSSTTRSLHRADLPQCRSPHTPRSRGFRLQKGQATLSLTRPLWLVGDCSNRVLQVDAGR